MRVTTVPPFGAYRRCRSDTASVHNSMSDTYSCTSPVVRLVREMVLASPAPSDAQNPPHAETAQQVLLDGYSAGHFQCMGMGRWEMGRGVGVG